MYHHKSSATNSPNHWQKTGMNWVTMKFWSQEPIENLLWHLIHTSLIKLFWTKLIISKCSNLCALINFLIKWFCHMWFIKHFPKDLMIFSLWFVKIVLQCIFSKISCIGSCLWFHCCSDVLLTLNGTESEITRYNCAELLQFRSFCYFVDEDWELCSTFWINLPLFGNICRWIASWLFLELDSIPITWNLITIIRVISNTLILLNIIPWFWFWYLLYKTLV